MDNNTEQAGRNTTVEADRAAQADTNVIADQAEALRHTWQAGAEIASNLTARSADQVARTFGVGGDVKKGASRVSGNIRALEQSAGAWMHGVQAISTEFVNLARHSTERSIDYAGAVMRCRSPQDFITAQTDAWRDNVQALSDSSRRIVEIALRTAQEAPREVLDKRAE